MRQNVRGLVAAVHTPFDPSGELNLNVVESQAAHLEKQGVGYAFVGGTTGECSSLTVPERLQLAERWASVARGSSVRWIAHVGSNCLKDSVTLSAQAEKLGAIAISAVAPCYLKPASVESLLACCSMIAASAPTLPFYYYEIPPLTGITLSMTDFFRQACDRIPNFAGLKYSSQDIMTFQQCLTMAGDDREVLFGVDEMLLSAWVVGARGAIGSTYNFAPHLYTRMIEAFESSNWLEARAYQLRSVELVRTLSKRGYMASAKALMGMLGVEVGPPRLPLMPLEKDQLLQLRMELEQGDLGLF